MRKDPAVSTAILLTHYGFELNGNSLPGVIGQWLDSYPNKWVLAAVVEALYQGRYKVSSVNRILDSWCSRGQPLPNFDHDFADFFCKKIIRAMLEQEAFKLATAEANKKKTKKIDAETRDSDRILVAAAGKTSSASSAPSSDQAPAIAKSPNPGIEEWSRLVTRL